MPNTWSQEMITTPAGTIGGELQRARIHRGLTLADLAKETRIRSDYLKAIEEHHFDDIPYAKVYQRNFIKRYATALELDPHKFSELFDAHHAPDEESTTVQTTKSYHLRFPNVPRLIRTILILAIVLLVIGYLVMQVSAMVSPPSLTVASPPNGAVTNMQAIDISGNTQEEIRVQINGEEISTSQSGQFSEEVILSPGMNTLQIAACNKHRRCTTEVRHVTFSPES